MTNKKEFGAIVIVISIALAFYFYDWELALIIFTAIAGNNMEQNN